MKKTINRINPIWFFLAIVIILAGVVFCLFAMTSGNPGKEPIPDRVGDVTTTGVTEGTQPEITTTTPEAVTEPATTTTEPESTEPVTTPEPEETTPVTTEPEDDDGDYIGVVYLTFDDGPSRLTPKYLDVLKEYGVNATFFVQGVQEDDEWKFDVMKRALDEGNRIALHGFSHDYATIYQSVDSATNNFYKENQQLFDALGVDIKIIRFPGGSSNTVSRNYCKNVMTDTAKILTDDGYNYFDWNISSGDAGNAVNSSADIYSNVINGVSPSKTNVVLMHDSGHHQATLDALPDIIEWLINAGYKLKVITDETPSVRHAIAN